MKGAQLLANELRRRGVTFIATLCGNGLDSFFAACEEAGIHLVDVRNEQSAGYIAECYGRLTGQVGVCAVSSGVAHANAMTGVVNAYFDGAPMLLISGSGALRTTGMGHFQDLDQVALAAPVCKYARVIDVADRIPQIVGEAFAAATSGKPGPVHLTFPMDIQEREARAPIQSPVAEQNSFVPGAGDEKLIAEAARWLGESKQPLLVAGSGVYYARGENALREFSEDQAVPVVVPIWDRGPVPEAMPTWMGVLGAATGGPRLLPDADLIIVAGAACDYRLGYLLPPAIRTDARVIRIDDDITQLQQGTHAHLSILGDPGTVLQQIDIASKTQKNKPHTEWLQEAQARNESFKTTVRSVERSTEEGKLHALDIIDAIQQVMTDDTVLLVDGGNIGQWAHQTLGRDRYPGHWLTCGASGVVGYGLPGAMAARILYPNRQVILLSGDGAMAFTITELEAASRQGMNFVVIVANDEAWGITLEGHVKKYGHPLASKLGPLRFDIVAQGLGAQGVMVTSVEELLPALRTALAASHPALIHVPVVKSYPQGDKS